MVSLVRGLCRFGRLLAVTLLLGRTATAVPAPRLLILFFHPFFVFAPFLTSLVLFPFCFLLSSFSGLPVSVFLRVTVIQTLESRVLDAVPGERRQTGGCTGGRVRRQK